jgi:ABC-type polysaccharide/polyol phosphate transport system ATPase subunit
MNYAVRTFGLCKTFSAEYNYMTVFKVLKRKLRGNDSGSTTFYALKDIHMDVRKGEKVAIVGNNGSGKTTLLKVIAGLQKPNSGQVQVEGAITLLAGLGVGMVDELTVKENIFLYGAIYGLDRKELKKNFCEIIEWAELEGFVEAKFGTLSSGMKSRLGFSIMRHFEADIFLLDEALTAGDKNFKKKCKDFFRNAQNTHKTFLMTTHDLDFVEVFCNKALWLHKGKQMAYGETENILKQYFHSNK